MRSLRIRCVWGETHTNRHGKTYTYYKCNRYHAHGKCKERYISEKKLVEELAEIVDGLKVESLSLSRRLKHEVEKMNTWEVMKHGEKARPMTEQDYIAFILKNGNAREKSDLLRGVSGSLFLTRGKVQWRRS